MDSHRDITCFLGAPADTLQIHCRSRKARSTYYAVMPLLGRGPMLSALPHRLEPIENPTQRLAHRGQRAEKAFIMRAADLDHLHPGGDRTPAAGRIVEIAPALGGTDDHQPAVIRLWPEQALGFDQACDHRIL